MRIFQTWKSEHELTGKFSQCRRSWIDMHPGHRYEFFGDAELLAWLERHRQRFPGVIDLGDQHIKLVDLFRYCQLFVGGGLYVDMDFYCVKPMEFIEHQYPEEVVLGSLQMPAEDAEHSVPNAWMYAGRPHHPFWLLVLAMALERKGDEYVERATGPILLKDAYTKYSAARRGENLQDVPNLEVLARLSGIKVPTFLPEVALLPPDVVYPLSWGYRSHLKVISQFRAADSLTPDLLDKVPSTQRTCAFTYWEHSWGADPIDLDVDGDPREPHGLEAR